MILYNIHPYNRDVSMVANIDCKWGEIRNKSILISGATGMIGSFLVDVLMEKNIKDKLNCTVYAIGRSEDKLKTRFSKYLGDSSLVFLQYDIQKLIFNDKVGKVDYVLHLASNTHPFLYSTDPIGTVLTNVIGVKNMLDFSVDHHARRFAFASSNEMYGENRGDVEFFTEDYCGYINCNTLRAGYPESKRCGETLCQAYRAQKGLDIVIPRLTRTFGPTMSMSDTKAASQFIKKGVNGEDIVLKSSGTQYFSYTYVADAVSGLLTVLLNGENGEAYNIADVTGDIMLKDFAAIVAEKSGTKVVFEKPDVVEAAGYSQVTKARLDGSKLRALGWKPQFDISLGIERTLEILKSERMEKD